MQKVTVITVVYNNAGAIEKTIQNVLKQTYPELEYVIVDGASTDGTTEIVGKYDQRIKWISEPDKGIYDAMMKGVRMATGEWVLFRNCGDFFLKPTSIEDIFRSYEDKGEDFLLANARLFRSWGYKDAKPSILSQSYFEAMPVLHPSTFVRRTTQLKYPFHLEYKNSADYCFFVEAMKNGAAYKYFDEVISLFECEVGATAQHYSRTVSENLDILKRYEAPVQNIHQVERYLKEVKRKEKIFRFIPFIEEYRKRQYLKDGWIVSRLEETLKNI